ncbi:MAG TPA: DUF4382 domain-containing protein [Gammaproteobacteria bacterium]|nr:DUF4382 domain-containing protein [Gammaproteobacteria bacterium]
MKKQLALIVAAGILGLGGCYGSYTNPTTFTLAVADTPVDGAEHVTLAFTGVQIQPSAGNTLEYDFGSPQVVDLLQQQGDNFAVLLDDLDIAAGSYTSVTMLVDTSRSFITLSDGSQHPLVFIGTIATSTANVVGIKLTSSFTIADQEQAVFVADYDLRKSISLAGAAYDFQPSVRFLDGNDIGEIEGTVSGSLTLGGVAVTNPACLPAAYVYAGNVTPVDLNPGSKVQPVNTATVHLDSISGQYLYESEYLPPGNYTVAIACAAGDNPATVDALSFSTSQQAAVAANSRTEVDF